MPGWQETTDGMQQIDAAHRASALVADACEQQVRLVKDALQTACQTELTQLRAFLGDACSAETEKLRAAVAEASETELRRLSQELSRAVAQEVEQARMSTMAELSRVKEALHTACELEVLARRRRRRRLLPLLLLHHHHLLLLVLWSSRCPFCAQSLRRHLARPSPLAQVLATRERCQDEVAQVKTALDKACALEVALVRDACQQEIVRVKECAARRGVEPPPATIGCAPADPKLPLRRRWLHTWTRPPRLRRSRPLLCRLHSP